MTFKLTIPYPYNMSEIRLIIYVIILFVSIISLITNSSRKRKNKKKAEEILQGLTSHRNISEDELKSLRDLYKRNGEVNDYQVFEIEGEYSFTEIRTKGSSIKTHFLNFIEVLWLPQLDNLVMHNNKAEIVFNSRGKAIVLSFNDKYSVTEESNFKDLLKGEATATTTDSSVAPANRSLTDLEIDYINSDVRVLGGLCLITALIVPIISSSYVAFGISAVFLLLSFFLYKKPKSTKHNNSSRLIKLSGIITKTTTGQFVLDRFTLFFPKNYEPELGVETEVEAYSFDDNGLNNKVLSHGTDWSINREYQFKPLNKKGKKIFLTVMLVIASIVYLFSGIAGRSVNNAIQFVSSYGAKRDFNSFHELKEYEIKLGQEIIINNQLVVPQVEGTLKYIIEKPLNIDFASIETRLNALYEIQHSDLYYQLVSVFMVDYDDVYSFDNKYLEVVKELDLEDYRELFKDNESYVYLADFWPKFLNGEIDPDYDKLESNFNNFFTIEAQNLENIRLDLITKALENVDKIELSYYDSNFAEPNIDDQSIRVFTLDYYSDIKYKSYDQFMDVLEELKETYNDPQALTISGGVIDLDVLTVSSYSTLDPVVDFYRSFLLLVILFLYINTFVLKKKENIQQF